MVNCILIRFRELPPHPRQQVAKLKASKGLHLVSMERIVRVLSALERNVRDASRLTPYLDEEAEGAIGDGEEDRMWRDVVMERVLRSADAALAALNIMCAPKMPKQVRLVAYCHVCLFSTQGHQTCHFSVLLSTERHSHYPPPRFSWRT